MWLVVKKFMALGLEVWKLKGSGLSADYADKALKLIK
jgi:hypothetical protein